MSGRRFCFAEKERRWRRSRKCDSHRSGRGLICPSSRTGCSTCGSARRASTCCAKRTRARRVTRSSTDPSPRTSRRWGSITRGDAPIRTSTSATRRCRASTSAGRTASTARACGWKCRSSASSTSTASATLRPTASTSSRARAALASTAARPRSRSSPSASVSGWTGTTPITRTPTTTSRISGAC